MAVWASLSPVSIPAAHSKKRRLLLPQGHNVGRHCEMTQHIEGLKPMALTKLKCQNICLMAGQELVELLSVAFGNGEKELSSELIGDIRINVPDVPETARAKWRVRPFNLGQEVGVETLRLK